MAYSIQTAVSDGTLEVLDLSIKYMDKSHIFVYVDDVLVDGSAYSYVWLTDTRIQVVPAVASGSTLKVIRKTLTDEMWHEFSKGARFSTTSMDENFEQLLFLAQEYSEGIYVSDFYSDVDLHLKRILNLGDPINDGDAVNLKTLKEYLPNADLIPPLVERIAAEEAKSTQLASQGIPEGGKVIVDFDGSALQHNAWVHLSGRDTVGDGAGGWLRFLKGSTATVDGGTVYAVTGGRLVREGWSVFGVDVSWWLGVGTDISAASAAFSTSKIVKIPPKAYTQTAPIVMQSGQIVYMEGATIKPSSALTSAAWVATSASGIRIHGGTLEGDGTAFTTGNEHLMLLTSCDDAQLFGTVFTKSRNEGLRLVGCTKCTMHSVSALNNYGSGLQDRDGNGNIWVSPKSVGNGNTGTATGAGGRGLLIWRCESPLVLGGSFKQNTEYGLRIYSQTGDAVGTRNAKIVGAHAEDNGVIDFYVYNESGLVVDAEFDACTVKRTTDPTGTCIALQGDGIKWNGGSVTKIGSRLTAPVFNMYGLSGSEINGPTVKNAGQLFAWSGSAVCDDVLITNVIAECSVVGALVGTNVTYRSNKFKHGGSGTTDIAIDAGTTYSPIIDGNEFNGFWRNVSWVAQAMTLRNNTSRNTTDVSLRMNGDGVAGLVSSGNDWDTGSNPTWVATAYRQKNPNSRITVYNGAAPTTLTWARGDRVIQPSPTVGQPKSWVCTVAGVPGTWVSEGTL